MGATEGKVECKSPSRQVDDKSGVSVEKMMVGQERTQTTNREEDEDRTPDI